MREDGSLGDLVRRLHLVVASVALAVVVAVGVVTGARLWPLAVSLGGLLVLARSRRPIFPLLMADLVVSVVLWWLFGPVSGAGYIPFGVVAVAAFVLSAKAYRRVLLAATGVLLAEVGLHFLAGTAPLPLFHPRGPVPDAEFVLGASIQVLILVMVGGLLVRMASTVRAGEVALTADLERERELHSHKDRFIATLSHELRTPLTALKGFARTIIDDETDPRSTREYVAVIADQAEELHTLVEDLLTFTRFESGQLSIEKRPLRLAEEVGSVLSGMGSRAEGVRVGVAADLEVVADPLRIRQTLRNLIDNALKYGREPVEVRAWSEAEWVRCRVVDGGDGLPESLAEEAFRPYTRFVDNTTMARPGAGLGLAIVRALVEAQGGGVSYLGPGLGFELRLPGVSASEAPDGPVGGGLSSTRGGPSSAAPSRTAGRPPGVAAIGPSRPPPHRASG